MLCDNCLKNEAKVHLTTFTNGQVKTLHLCPQCAAQKGKATSIVGPNLNDFMSSFYEKEESDVLVCKNCGTTLDDFSKTGKLGCANCYSVFRESVNPVLKGIHMNTEHKGKRPGQVVELEEEKQSSRSSRDKLKKELQAAVAAENYEEAAKLRDEIALLDKEGEKHA